MLSAPQAISQPGSSSGTNGLWKITENIIKTIVAILTINDIGNNMMRPTMKISDLPTVNRYRVTSPDLDCEFVDTDSIFIVVSDQGLPLISCWRH
jgi:hypothetical protein